MAETFAADEGLNPAGEKTPLKEQEESPAPARRRKAKARKSLIATRGGTRRFALGVRRKINASLKEFLRLTSLEADVKKELLLTVRKSLLRVVYTREANDRIMSWAENLSFIVFCVFAMVVMPWLVTRVVMTPEEHAEVGVVMLFFKTGVSLFLMMLVVVLPFLLLLRLFSQGVQTYVQINKAMRWLLVAVAFACLAAAGALVSAARGRVLGEDELFILFGCLAFGTYFGGGTLVIPPIINGLRRWLDRRAEKTFTNEYLVAHLLSALAVVEKNPARWADVEFRRLLIARLEAVAVCVERVVPGRMRSGNIVTDKWLADSTEEIAAGVRALAKWVITPNKDTHERLRERLAVGLTCAVRGEWDGFERVSPEKLSQPELLKSRLVNFAKALASASVPVIVLLLVKRADLVPDGPVLNYLTAGAYIWAALSFLSGLDPQYGAKITAIKDIAGFLPIPGKGKSS